MTESESFNVNEPSMTKKPINSFDQIRTQNEEESKENVMPPNELDDIELTIVQKLKNEEDTSDSLKSLDGSILDNEEKNGKFLNRQQSSQNNDKSVDDSEQTTETDNADDELKNNDENLELNKSMDAISTSDIVAQIDNSSSIKGINDHQSQLEEEQKVMQAQANYNLSSLNYKKSTQDLNEEGSDSDADLLMKADNCKCETIRKDHRVKTKTCTLL